MFRLLFEANLSVLIWPLLPTKPLLLHNTTTLLAKLSVAGFL